MPDLPIKDDKPEDDALHDERGASALDDEAKAQLEPRGEEDSSDEGDDPEAADAASPEAIARRVAALGDDDETDRLARDEELKLAERRSKQKKKKGRGGLEAAATKKLAKIGAKAVVRRSVATAVEADPLIDRAAKLNDWAQKNQATVAIIAGAVVVAGLSAGVYEYVQKRHETQASTDIAKAMDDEHGRIGDPDKDDEEGRPHDPRPVFKTAEDRREAALREYRDVASRFRNTGAGILARLAEGSILLDKEDVAGALSALMEVKGSALAKADAEVRGRALEGLGFAYELKADAEQGDAVHGSLEDALKAFRELENTDVLGFEEFGMYHQARVLEKQGEKAKAIDLLKKLHERLLGKPGEAHAFLYLEQVADDRLRALDPTAIAPKSAGQFGGPGQKQFSPAQVRKLMEQMQKRGEQPTSGGAPSSPSPMPPEDLPP